MKLNPEVFREYDVRGTVDRDLNPDFAYLLGRAFASLAAEQGSRELAVGHDCRISSPPYAEAVARGICDEGLNCVFTGLGPTPQLYYAVFADDLGGGVQITGSHNPPDMNGFKLLIGKRTLSGADIQNLRARMEQLADRDPAAPHKGSRRDVEIRQRYTDELIANVKPHMGSRRMKVVVDGGNGVGGLVGPQVLRGLGLEVIELYCEPDGRFPNHHPDPTVLENIVELRETVRREKADFGIGWDGDADRIGVVDERGEVVFGDMLLLIYGRDIAAKVPGATIIGDVKSSSRLFDDLRSRGANAIMWKTGHSLIKGKLHETGGALGGEMSGHMFFKHRFYGFDDALYASARLAEIVSHTEGAFSTLLQGIPPMVSTPEIRLECPETVKFQLVKVAVQAFPEFKVDTTDGARISFPHGWGLVRASNTQPVIVLRFEADSQERLEEYQTLVMQRLEGLKHSLSS